MPDTQYGAPQAQGSGIGDYFAEHPWAKWVALGAVGGIIYFVWSRRRAASPAVAGTGATDTVSGAGTGPSYLINPTTNLPINPYTGQDFGQIASPLSDEGAWVNAALKALTAAGASATEAENAIYRFLNGLSLTAAQQNLINTALGQVGAAPGGPYPVTPAPTPVVTPPQGHFLNPVTWVWNNLAPATVAAGTGLLQNLGYLGRGQILTPQPGSAIYARVRGPRGTWIWRRITSLAQYVNLPVGTQIGALRGTATTPVTQSAA